MAERTALDEVEQAIWTAYCEEHDVEAEPDHWPEWLIGSALDMHGRIEAAEQQRDRLLAEVKEHREYLGRPDKDRRLYALAAEIEREKADAS